jgi:hypothetical protein
MDHNHMQHIYQQQQQQIDISNNNNNITDFNNFDMLYLIQPIVNVIKGETTNALCKGMAVATLHRLLDFEILSPDALNCQDAINTIVDAVVNCRFEQTDTGADEIAIMWILETIISCFKCKAGQNFLSRINIWDMFETSFSIATELTHADMLRTLAFRTVSILVRQVFTQAFILKQEQDNFLPIALQIFRYLCMNIDPDSTEINYTSVLDLSPHRLAFDLLVIVFESVTIMTKNN